MNRTEPRNDAIPAMGRPKRKGGDMARCMPHWDRAADTFQLMSFEPEDFKKIGCQEMECQLSAWADDMLKTEPPAVSPCSTLKSLLPDDTKSDAKEIECQLSAWANDVFPEVIPSSSLTPRVPDDTAMPASEEPLVLDNNTSGTESTASHAISDGPPAAATPTNRSSFLLWTPQDDLCLSETLCFFRSQIEVFEATAEDVHARLRKGGIKSQSQITTGRVGLRCIHCAHRHPDVRPKGATTYPASTRLVYQAVRNLQRYHFASCPNMPPKHKLRLQAMKNRRRHSNHSSVGYWEESAQGLGFIDMADDRGIRLQK